MSNTSHTGARPIVLVSADVRQLHGFVWHAAIDTYLKSLAGPAQVSPLVVPAFGPTILSEAVWDAACGVLATGSRSNVHPQLFGQDPSEAFEPYDQDRDATAFPMIEGAIARGLPLLAICRGHQELNVAYGGTLETEVQTQEGRLDHRGGALDDPLDQRFAPNHTITLTPGGKLANILATIPGSDTALTVNSVHRQAIGKLGDGLQIEAQAEDGTIEAISVKDAKSFTLGVQWHPEYWASQETQEDAPSTKIFEAFGDAVRAFKR